MVRSRNGVQQIRVHEGRTRNEEGITKEIEWIMVEGWGKEVEIVEVNIKDKFRILNRLHYDDCNLDKQKGNIKIKDSKVIHI